MARKKRSVVFGVVFLICVVLVGVILGVSLSKRIARHPDRGLPIMEIDLNGVDLGEIDGGDKDIEYNGNEVRILNDNRVSEYSEVEIKGRGNSTWDGAKKPYRLKFNKKVDLFGMGKAKKWYLLANYADETNLRNETAFYLASMLGMEYVLEGQYMEVYIDGDYRGLYYLTHAVEINNNVVGLNNPLGVLMELDNLHNMREEQYKTSNGDILTVKDVVNKVNEKEAIDVFLQSYNELEVAIREKNYERIQEITDVRSIAQYYLLSEFIVNPDAYATSFYFYKDGVEDKIHFGPGWDFDLTLGNRKWENWLGERFYSPNETMVRKLELSLEEWVRLGYREEDFEENLSLSRIMFDLAEIPEFQDEVKRVFQERLMSREDELIIRVTKEASEIQEAAVANNVRWDIEDFSESVQDLITWIRARYSYFVEMYGSGEDVEKVVLL